MFFEVLGNRVWILMISRGIWFLGGVWEIFFCGGSFGFYSCQRGNYCYLVGRSQDIRCFVVWSVVLDMEDLFYSLFD